MTTSICAKCKAVLSRHNPGSICLSYQEEFLDNWALTSKTHNLEVEDMRQLLHFESQEQVMRQGRDGKLPPRVPAIKKWLWVEDVVRDWMRNGWEFSEDVKSKVNALAEALGGVNIDEDTGETKVGDKVDIQVMVYSKESNKSKKIVRETKKKSFIIPRHLQ